MEQFFANNTILTLVVIWSLPWKGVALWKAAQLKDKWWFVVLLVVNLAGLLEILYIFFFSKRKGLTEKKAEN
ncbi:MAG: DUF5652 family protein [bacterium]|nr:DUF5652 family protein [bacterium]